MAKRSTIERLLSKVQINQNGCWIWTAALNSSGYGSFWNGKTVTGAHRTAWILLRGIIPDRLEVDHYLLNNPATKNFCDIKCCNPDHMRLVTHKTNLTDSWFIREAAKQNIKLATKAITTETRRKIAKAKRTNNLPEGVTFQHNGKGVRTSITPPGSKKAVHLGSFAKDTEHNRELLHNLYMKARSIINNNLTFDIELLKKEFQIVKKGTV